MGGSVLTVEAAILPVIEENTAGTAGRVHCSFLRQGVYDVVRCIEHRQTQLNGATRLPEAGVETVVDVAVALDGLDRLAICVEADLGGRRTDLGVRVDVGAVWVARSVRAVG